MDIQSLKRYIYQNNKIEHILTELGCHNIKYNERHEYYSAAHKDGDNPAGVIINNNEYLNYISYSRGVKASDRKDIVDLVQYSKHLDFISALKWLHTTLSLEFSVCTKQQRQDAHSAKDELLAVFKRIAEGNRYYEPSDEELRAIEEESLTDYAQLLHINWFREGIMPWAREKFGLCYSYKHRRMVIPIKYWATGELVGVNQRTMIDNWQELGIPKYFITPSYQKRLNLYGLWENKETIEKAGYVVIVESEKSVLKRYSKAKVNEDANAKPESDGTLVALQGKTMSEEQRRIIMSLHIREVIVCLDLDVPIEEVMSICDKFYGLRKVSFIYVPKDERDKFGPKDSPCDASNDVYERLFVNRIEYDDRAHMAYQRMIGK